MLTNHYEDTRQQKVRKLKQQMLAFEADAEDYSQRRQAVSVEPSGVPAMKVALSRKSIPYK